MAKKVYEEAKIAAIADKIREKTGGTETYTTAQMPSGVDTVYAKGETEGYSNGYSVGETEGYTQGYTEGETAGIEAGKKAEYDAFWDVYQENGKKVDYQRNFSGNGWTLETFKPKYDITPAYGGGASMFHNTGFVGSMKKHLESLNVKLDCNRLLNANQIFYQAKYITELPEMNFSGCTNGLSYTFYECQSLTTIEKLKVSEVVAYNNVFDGCTALVHLIVNGTIGQNGFNVQWSTKLSKESITSIINALSTTTSGLTVTLSKTAVNTAFATTEGGTDGLTSDEWAALVATKPNWTISLV